MPIQQPNLIARYAQGLQTGNALQQMRTQRSDQMRQSQARNALAGLVSGNAQPNTLAQLAQADPGAAMKFQKFQTEQGQAQREQQMQQAAQRALEVRAALQSGNVPLAMQTLQQAPDSPQKQQALQLLSEGQVEPVLQMNNSMIRNFEQMGQLESGPTQPSSVREYQFARQQGYEGSYQDFITQQKKSGATNISVNTGDKFGTEMGKSMAERRAQIIDTGQSAVGTEQNLMQMADLMSSGEVQTGSLQPLVTSLQGVAADFGVDIGKAAETVGIENVGNLDKKEEFDRLSKQVIIDGFEKFKGNLNNREVQLAQDAFANMGRSEDANKRAIASGLAAAQISRERAIEMNDATTPEAVRGVTSQLLRGDTQRFENLRKQYLEQIQTRDISSVQEARQPGGAQGAQSPQAIDFSSLPE